MNRSLCFVFLTAACFIGGCTLDDVVAHGAVCPPKDDLNSTVVVLDTACFNTKGLTSEKCTESKATQIDFNCPTEFDHCVAKDDIKALTKEIKDDDAVHDADYVCLENSEHCCGPQCINCLKTNVFTASCENNKCIATDCKDGYVLEGNDCIKKCTTSECSYVQNNVHYRNACKKGRFVLEACTHQCKNGQCVD